MATRKVGIYRKYHGKVPKDPSGQPLPKSRWPKRRLFRWAVRWFGEEGNRYNKSFRNRKEAEEFAATKRSEVRVGKADPPPGIRLWEFVKEHERVMQGQVARATLVSQLCALRMFMDHFGKNVRLCDVKRRHAEAFVAARLASGRKVPAVNKDIRTLKAVFNLAIVYVVSDSGTTRASAQVRVFRSGRRSSAWVFPDSDAGDAPASSV